MSRRVRMIVAKLGLFRGLAYYLRAKHGSGLMQVTPPGTRQALWLRAGSSDAKVFEDIFLRDQYALPTAFVPEVIVDAGANVGYAAVFFAQRLPQARIIAIEPEASNLALLKRNAARFPNIEVVEGGLWGHDTRLAISNPDDAKWAIQVREAPDAADALPAHSVDSLMKRFRLDRIDLFKIDIEGSELNLFSAPGAGSWLSKVRQLVIELHDRDGYPAGIEQAFDAAIAPFAHTRRQRGEDTIVEFQGVSTC
jgi:FkbM family methyltransferase